MNAGSLDAIKVRNVKSGAEDGKFEGQIKISKVVKTDREIICCSYTGDRNTIAAGTTLGTLELFNGRTGKHTITLVDDDVIEKFPCPLTEIIRRPTLTDHNLLCSYTSGLIKNWNPKTHTCQYTIQESRQIIGLAHHPHHKKFLSLGDDGAIFMYDEETRKVIHKFTSSDFQVSDGHTNRVFSACFHPTQEHEFVSGGWDETVQFWDTRQAHSARHLSGLYICGDGLAINERGTDLLTCAWVHHDAMKIFDYGSGQLRQVLKPDIYSSQLYCCKYLGYNFFVCGGTKENLLRVVDLRSLATMGVVKNLPGGVYELDVASRPRDHSPPVSTVEDMTQLPGVVFCAGHNLYEIKFTYYLLSCWISFG